MTPEESATLVSIGEDLRQTFAAIIFEALLFSLYGVCVFKACSILNRKARTWMLMTNMTIIITMFLIATSLIAIDISNFVTEVTVTFIHKPDLSIDTRYANASNVTFKRVVIIDAMYGWMTVLGDAIVVWRVYAFWGKGKRRWALLFLCAMLFGTTIVTILLNYCLAVLGTDIFEGAIQRPLFCRNIQTTSYAMPAATTFVATALIGFTTWEYRRAVKPDLSKVSRKTRVEKVMLLLVESGFIYFLFFLAQVINNIPAVSAATSASPNLSFAGLVFTFSTSVIVGWYPTVIIIIAHSKRTVLDKGASSTLPSLQFNGSTTYAGSSQHENSLNRTKKAEEIELPAVSSFASEERVSHERKGTTCSI